MMAEGVPPPENSSVAGAPGMAPRQPPANNTTPGQLRVRDHASVNTVTSTDATVREVEGSPTLETASRNVRAGQSHVESLWVHRYETAALVLVTLVALLVRVYRLGEPRAVVFDETHFVRFAVYYLRGHFFFDIHPPLGKLTFAAAGYLSGLLPAIDAAGSASGRDISFDKIGTLYPAEVDYVALRLVSTVVGTLLVPLCWGIVRRLGHSALAGCAVGVMVALDNALVTASRVIMLDAQLLFWTMAAVYFVLGVRDDEANEFSISYFLHLTAAGISLGCATSIKMVGLGSVGVVGVYTVVRLWDLWGQPHRSVRRFWLHVAARFGLVLCLPIGLYLGFFLVHLRLVPLSGPGDGFVSREFQRTIQGNGFALAAVGEARELHAHSTVTIRRMYGDECWLTVADGPESTTTRCSTSRGPGAASSVATEHLWWELVVLPHQAGGSDAAAAALKHRSVTLLRHVATGTFLSASIGESGTQLKVVAPLPALQQWNNVTELAEAMWRIEILGGDDVVLRTPSSLVRLSHVNTSLALQCTNDVVDSDGTSDLVFPCIAGANIHDTTGGWHFDRAQIQANNGGTDGQRGASAAAAMTSTMSSMAKIIELHSVIFKRNNEMSGEHTFGSRPPDWPLMHRGIIFWHGSAHGVPTKGCTAQVYFLGNPAVWWAAATAVPLYVLFDVMYTVRIKRGIHDLPMSQVSTLMQSGRLLIAAWIIHFVPFFFFDRLLFLHHYLPALVFSIMVAGVMLEHIWVQWTPAGIASHVALVWLAVVAGCFICFTPFNFATALCGDGLEQRQWRASWDLHGLDAADPSATVT